MLVLAICGSLQSRSTNLSLLQTAIARAPAGVDISLFDGIRELPHFNLDLEKSGPPPAVVAWRQALTESDALLIASPEYGISLPGALKNAIDWVIGSGELYQKPVAVTAAVPSSERGRRGLSALKEPLGIVGTRMVGGEPIVVGPSLAGAVDDLLRKLIEETERGPAGASEWAMGSAERPAS